MGTNCAPLVADLFLYCYERDFMDSLNHDNQADVIGTEELTKCYEPLQKLRVRLWPCRVGLSPPVALCY